MRLEGNYHMRGRILVIPLNGRGKCFFEPSEFWVWHQFQGASINDGNKSKQGGKFDRTLLRKDEGGTGQKLLENLRHNIWISP